MHVQIERITLKNARSSFNNGVFGRTLLIPGDRNKGLSLVDDIGTMKKTLPSRS